MTDDGTRAGVTGRVADEDGVPLPGLVVRVNERRALTGRRVIARALTDARGRFDVACDARVAPDVEVAVRDGADLRDVTEPRTFPRAPGDVLHVPEIVVPRADATGWLATLGRGAPARFTAGNDVAFLVDAEVALGDALRAIRGARRTIHVSQLLFEEDFNVAYPDGHGVRLADALRDAHARGVTVRFLLNENRVLPDGADAAREAFKGGRHGVRVRFSRLLRGVMHAKLLVVDDAEAFILGHPFEQKFWDTREHHARDARRGSADPRHDVSVRLRGPAVADVARVFADLWNHADATTHGGADPVIPGPAPAPEGAQAVQVALTLTREAGPREEAGTLEALTRALGNASRTVYVETQYFTSATLVERIRRVLDRNPDLEVVLVVNERVDVPTYMRWQDARVKRLGHPDHPRLGVFSLWVTGEQDGRPAVRREYVHSTLVTVDDAWLYCGNANLDGVSLDAATELGLPHARNVDAGVVLPDGVDGHTATGAVARVRRDVWAEHLACAPNAPEIASPEGGLTLWRERAARNLDAVRAGHPLARGRVLPYRPDVADAQVIPPGAAD